jgi:hypothetical protein
VSFWRQLTRRAGGREAADRDVADDVAHYLEETTAASREKRADTCRRRREPFGHRRIRNQTL